MLESTILISIFIKSESTMLIKIVLPPSLHFFGSTML